MKRFVCLVLLLGCLALPVAAADRPGVGPSVLFDAKTGELISQDRAGEPWYPASLTKLMTAYVVFQKIRAGALTLDRQIPVSDFANAQEPSKIGVPPGKTVSVDFALQALLVYSANDMAVVLAEAAGGTVGGFSDLMNAEARRIGLNASHFVNPNGLFDPRQITSARDMGVIAHHIVTEFPEYQRYFEQDSVSVGQRRLSNRNSLLRSMPESDGMKTGFVCNSGFNLVASATRNGRRLIAVVLGAKSGWARAQLAQMMLETGFERQNDNQKIADIAFARPASGVMSDMTSTVCPRKDQVLYANAERFNGWNIALGYFETPAQADTAVRRALLESRGMELSGQGGVLQMPNKGKFAAFIWGLDESESETYCEQEKFARRDCRVYDPTFLAALAEQKKREQPSAVAAQGSDGLRKIKVTVKARSKIKPARRIEKVIKAPRKSQKSPKS